jgi:hypothetical protein
LVSELTSRMSTAVGRLNVGLYGLPHSVPLRRGLEACPSLVLAGDLPELQCGRRRRTSVGHPTDDTVAEGAWHRRSEA